MSLCLGYRPDHKLLFGPLSRYLYCFLCRDLFVVGSKQVSLVICTSRYIVVHLDTAYAGGLYTRGAGGLYTRGAGGLYTNGASCLFSLFPC